MNAIKAICAAAAMTFGGAALADPIYMDFTGIGNGAQVANFYSGGADSMGNAGTANYAGVRVQGTVGYTGQGAYLKGGTLTIDGDAFGNQPLAVRFLGSSFYNETYVDIDDMFGHDRIFVDANKNPMCTTQQSCDAGHFWYTAPDTLGGIAFVVTGDALINFSTLNMVDNIEIFGYAGGRVERPATRTGGFLQYTPNGVAEAPEPASLALFGAGLLAFAARGRKRRPA